VSDMTRRMVCGGLAGMIAKTATNPLERIKMLSQTGDHLKTSRTNSIIGIYQTIIRQEGVIGLWAGNGVNLVRIFPAKAVVFSTNDMYRNSMVHVHDILTPLLQGTARSSSSITNDSIVSVESLPAIYSFLAGGMAGMSASLVTYPLDLARGRISGKLASSRGHKTYNGILQTCVLTVRDEGFRALYKGVTPTLIGAMPYEGIKFGTVGLLEKVEGGWYSTNPNDSPTTRSNSKTIGKKMLYGGIGGIMAGIITYPNDTVRRLLQIQGSRGDSNAIQFTGYWDCVRKTYEAEGVRRFYRGCTINIIRMAPNTAIQFGSYELLKQWSSDLV
jgi:Mitochondrial carrier protein